VANLELSTGPAHGEAAAWKIPQPRLKRIRKQRKTLKVEHLVALPALESAGTGGIHFDVVQGAIKWAFHCHQVCGPATDFGFRGRLWSGRLELLWRGGAFSYIAFEDLNFAHKRMVFGLLSFCLLIFRPPRLLLKRVDVVGTKKPGQLAKMPGRIWPWK
jgi:hypothetical protein